MGTVRASRGLVSSLANALEGSSLTVFIVSFVSDVSLFPMSLVSVVRDVGFSVVDFFVLDSVVVDADAVVVPLRIVLYLEYLKLVHTLFFSFDSLLGGCSFLGQRWSLTTQSDVLRYLCTRDYV